MDVKIQAAKADRLRQLHQGPKILVLANAWDAASAIIFESAGFPAIATTSGGVAYTFGYPDGEYISRDEMLSAVARIARAVAVPVSADMEAGYGNEPRQMKDLAVALIVAGAVGLNLEDSGRDNHLTDIAVQVAKIRALRAAGDEAGVPLVINARSDAFWKLAAAEPKERFDETVKRARAYREAGADSIFIVGARDRDTIAAFVREIPAPLNILAGPGVPPVSELEALGVRRLSVGAGPMRATLALTRRIAEELRDKGTYTGFTEGGLTHDEANRIFEK
jgi:2-methylisocitrate lyase-like PEP mutase family enzyme